MTFTFLCKGRAQKVVATLLAAVALCASTIIASNPASASSQVRGLLEEQFFTQINAERAARGLPAVVHDDELAQRSAQWSDSMAASQDLRHSGDGRAEIIARGYWTGQITEAWMLSSGHRNLIVDPNLRWAGVGISCDAKGQLWATVQFERNDKSKPTLSASATRPIATVKDSGTGCSAERYLGGVMRLYAAFFRRNSDESGLMYWLERRGRGDSLEDISAFFASSEEFKNTYGSLSNREFMLLIYRNVMRRSADDAGLNYWVGMLNARKINRGELMVQFSESAEFKKVSGIGG